MIIFHAPALVSAALREVRVPERALLRAEASNLFAFSAEVDAEIAEMLTRLRFAWAVTAARQARILDILRCGAAWFIPTEREADGRDAEQQISQAGFCRSTATIVSGDANLLVLDFWRGVRILQLATYLAAAEGSL